MAIADAILRHLRARPWPAKAEIDPKIEREANNYILILFLGAPLVVSLIVAGIFLVQHLQRRLVPVLSLQPCCVVLERAELENTRAGRYVRCDRAEAAVAEAASRRGAEDIVVSEAARATVLVAIDGTAYERTVFIHGADLDMARNRDALWINPVHRKTQKIVVANDWGRILVPFELFRVPLLCIAGALAAIWGLEKLRVIFRGRAGAE